MINEFVLGVAVILLTGLLFGLIAKKLKVPNVTGYLIGGLLIGPVFVNLIIPSFSGLIGWDMVHMLSLIVDIELGFIAFTVGSEFKISYFKQVGLMPVIIAFAEALAAVVFITCGMLIFGAPLYFALCMGAVGAATAPAATILVIRQYKAKGELSQTLLSVVAIDDAAALIFFGIAMAIVKSLIGESSGILMSIFMPFIEIGVSLALGLVLGIILTLIMKITRTNGNRLVLVVAILFFGIGICILLNDKFNTSFSSLLTCMAIGAFYTNSSKTVDDVMPLVETITPPLVVIFFIVSGAELQISSISWTGLLFLLVYLVFRVAGKVLGTFISAKACKAPLKIKKWLGFGLLPQGGIAIGLSAMVALMIPVDIHPVFNGNLIRVIVLCAVLASEVFGPILAKYALFKSGEAQLPERKSKKIKEKN